MKFLKRYSVKFMLCFIGLMVVAFFAASVSPESVTLAADTWSSVSTWVRLLKYTVLVLIALNWKTFCRKICTCANLPEIEGELVAKWPLFVCLVIAIEAFGIFGKIS